MRSLSSAEEKGKQLIEEFESRFEGIETWHLSHQHPLLNCLLSNMVIWSPFHLVMNPFDGLIRQKEISSVT